MFTCPLSEQERGGCLAPGQGGQSWGVGVPPEGCCPPTPCCWGSALGKAASRSQPRREGGRRGAGPASAAEEPGGRGCSKKHGRPRLDLLSAPRELAGSGGGSTALAWRGEPASTPPLGSCPSRAPLPPLPGNLFQGADSTQAGEVAFPEKVSHEIIHPDVRLI